MQHEIDKFEELLEVKFPISYRQFLEEYGSKIIDGYKVMGFANKAVPMTVIDATIILRKIRPDLNYYLIPIIIIKDKVVCMALSDEVTKDADLAEVSLLDRETPIWVRCTFSQWVNVHAEMSERILKARRRIKNRQKETRGKSIQDWSSTIFRVSDYVIGLGAFRYSFIYGALEIDEFLPINQPHMIKDEPLKVLLSEAFIRARDYSGSLKMVFTRLYSF